MASENCRPDWYEWPEETTLGDCKISVTHDRESKAAISVSACPANATHSGAYIHCFLQSKPANDQSFSIYVEPSMAAYWSSRRRGPATKVYFFDNHPKLAVSLLHALESNDREDRLRALIHLTIALPKGVAFNDGESFATIAEDGDRFKQLADGWLSKQRQSLKGATQIDTAERHVSSARAWHQSLLDFEALKSGESEKSGVATPTQCAVFLAVKQATREYGGIPLLSNVRELFGKIVVSYNHKAVRAGPMVRKEEDRKKLTENDGKDVPRLRAESFDKALRDLGFFWLPKAWPKSSEFDPSD